MKKAKKTSAKKVRKSVKNSAPAALGAYDPAKIEKKWQKKWNSSKIYKSVEDKKKDKYYVLDMFPYPSGEGLHVGHPKGYIATDVVSRMNRMKGKSVLHPMGFDAFGLPAENYALKTKTAPQKAVQKNVKRFKEQLQILGLDYDWSREINTTDPGYYKWTQWIFLQLFKKGLAYESYEPINWCPVDKTGLANEDVIDGRCERCGTPVEKKPMRQWVLKITDYAERLLRDLDVIDTTGLPHIIDKKNPPKPGKSSVERRTIHALVRDPKTGKYLGLKWKKHPWTTFIVGGVEDNEDIIEAAKREVAEETGYCDLKFLKLLGSPVKAEYFAAHKDQNRVAITSGVLFELASDKKKEIEKHEIAAHEPVWLDRAEMTPEVMTCAELPVWLERLDNDSETDHPAHISNKIQPLLKWPESIKELQRNWIGRSEGALIPFKMRANGQEYTVEVFTTRPDTIFGVTYIVLAPEHRFVQDLLARIENREEVQEYINQSKSESEIERTATDKPKTGVQLKGVRATNPANGGEVPVWIADYVLPDYGTGAVMAVPAHDERDGQFAKKFGLPVKEVIIPMEGEPHPGAEFRKTVSAIVRRKSDGKFLALKWKKFGWLAVPIGGIEGNESPELTAEREVLEETGYKAKAVKLLGGQIESHFFAENKNVWRARLDQPVLLELTDENPGEISAEEKGKHEAVWLSGEELIKDITHKYNAIGVERYLKGDDSFTGYGKLINSGAFDGKRSGEVMREITEASGGKWVTKFKIRDWVFSRQRYWGEPIPVVHCMNCALAKFEKEVKLTLNFYFEPVWKALKDGSKTVETRALNPEEKDRFFGDVKIGDTLRFSFRDKKTGKAKEGLLFKVRGIKTYKTLKDLFEDKETLSKLGKKKYSSYAEFERSYAYTPEYVQKINKNGIIAWNIEPVSVAVPVPEKNLPVKLPVVKSYEPTGTGESPLAGISSWVNTKCPVCKGPAKRETNTMPQWAGSSWYYLRYEDPRDKKKLVDPKNERYWSPVDLYVGGAEHATRHLIYARFWHKFLYDIGAVSTIEPFIKLQHVGLIMGEDGRKMSKRFGNVVNPDDMVKAYGADTMRVYEMFMGPFDQQIAWSTGSMVGARRFIERIWKLREKVGEENAPAVDRVIHKAIKKVSEDIENLRFNTAISSLMIAVNELDKADEISRFNYGQLLKLLAPFAPHVTDELWSELGNKKSIHISSWPEYDPKLAADSEVTIIVQVNGKVRGSFKSASDSSKEELEKSAKELPEAKKWIEGKNIQKVIVVPNRLVNIVVSE